MRCHISRAKEEVMRECDIHHTRSIKTNSSVNMSRKPELDLCCDLLQHLEGVQRTCCVVRVVFTSNRFFYSTTSVDPVSVLILQPREMQIMWSQTETAKNQNNRNSSRQGELNASVPGTRTQQNKPDQKNNKSRTKKTQKPTGVLKNVMQEDQKGCKKNSIRAEEEQITAARAKQHKDEE